MLAEKERHAVWQTMKELHAQGLIYLKSGNISQRTASGHVAIKPSGASYERMQVEDIVIVDLQGRVVDGRLKPSSETPMHTLIYRECPEVNAVVHTHAPHALVLASLGLEIPFFCNENLLVGGPVPVTEYACAGTEAIGRAVLRALLGPPHVKAALIRNHGAISVGATLEEAALAAQAVEVLARAYHAALQNGEPAVLTEVQIEELYAVYS